MSPLTTAHRSCTLALAASLLAAASPASVPQAGPATTLTPAQRAGIGVSNSSVLQLSTIDWDGAVPRETVVAASGDGIRIHRMGLTAAGSFLVPTDPNPFDVLVLDLDGDGHEDLLWSSAAPTTAVTWARRIPSGEFEQPIVLSSLAGFGAGTSVRGLATGDVNGDGLLDIVFGTTGGTAADRGVHYLLGTPSASFATAPNPVTVEAGTRCYAVACADMDADGHMDLLSESAGELAIFFGDGQPTPGWSKQPLQHPAAGTRDIFAADLDGNGLLDLAVATSGANQGVDPAYVWTALQVTPRGFPSSHVTTHATGLLYRSITASDFDQDGDHDLAVTRSDTGEVTLFPGTGVDSFGPAILVSSSLPDAYGSHIADWDGDGDDDLFVAHGKDCSVIENVAARSFAMVSLVAGFAGINNIVAMDVDLDGDEDLVGQSGNELWQSSLDPAGFLTSPAVLSPPWLSHSGADLCAWDWDQDGIEELIVIKDALLTWWEPSATGLTLAGSYGLNPAPVEEIAWIGVARRGESSELAIDHAWYESYTDPCGDDWGFISRMRRTLGPGGPGSPLIYGGSAEGYGDISSPPCYVGLESVTWLRSGALGGQPSGSTASSTFGESYPDVGAGSSQWDRSFDLATPEGSWGWGASQDWPLGTPGLVALGAQAVALAGGDNDTINDQLGPLPRWSHQMQGGAVLGVPEDENLLMWSTTDTRWHEVQDRGDDLIQTYFPGGARVAEFAADLALGADLDFDGDDELLLVHNGELYISFDTRPIEDCNGNGFHDPAEVHRGFTSDCDADGAPDSCQITAAPSLDCDGDGTLDSCQIAADPSLDWNGDGVIDTCAGGGFVYCNSNLNASGAFGLTEPLGSPLIGDDDFSLRAYGLPTGNPGVPGMFIMSRSPGYINPFGGGAGVLCLGAPIRRFNLAAGFPLQFSGVAGEISLNAPIADFPGPNPVQPGEVIHFQLWFREIDSTTGLPTSNTTDGIRVMFR